MASPGTTASGVRAWWLGLGQPAGPAQSADQHSIALLRTLRAVIRSLALRNNGIDSVVDATVTALLRASARPSLAAAEGLP